MTKDYTPTRKTPKTNKAIGLFLTIKREKMKLSIRGASALTGIDYAVLNRMEKGTFRLSFPNAITFSKVYKFDLNDMAKKAVHDSEGRLI